LKENEKELKFPKEFKKCPGCGSTKRIAQTVGDQEKSKGKIAKDTIIVIEQKGSLVYNPFSMIAVLSAPLIISNYDVCAKCGMYYCVYSDMKMVNPQSVNIGQQPPGATGPLPPGAASHNN